MAFYHTAFWFKNIEPKNILLKLTKLQQHQKYWCCWSTVSVCWGCPGEASGATHPLSLLKPLILLRVIRGRNWSQHCARQPWKANASLPHTLLSVRPQKRNFRTAIYSDNDNVHVDTTVQLVDFDPVAVRQHNEHHRYFVSKKRFSFYSWSWNNSLEATALWRSPTPPASSLMKGQQMNWHIQAFASHTMLSNQPYARHQSQGGRDWGGLETCSGTGGRARLERTKRRARTATVPFVPGR